MPIQKQAEVRVQCNGQSLQEYPVPVSEAAPDDEHVCYIEATAGERFQVLIRYLPGYRVDRAKSLVAKFSLDGFQLSAPPKLSRDLVTWNGALVDSTQHLCSFYSANITKHLSKKFYYSFGALEITETVDKSKQYDQELLDHLGEIKVMIYRGGAVSTDSELHINTLPETYEEVPAKRMKGRLLKNNVKFEDAGNDFASPGTTVKPLPGKAGKVTTFTFRYRSKKILKQIGCIERTPSPEPDHALMLERQEEMIKDAKEKTRQANLEILRLRQQLAKSDGPRELKRKREENGDDDELEEMAPPPKKALIVVDLTEDDE